jgi:hypothetical protein
MHPFGALDPLLRLSNPPIFPSANDDHNYLAAQYKMH